MFRQTILHPKSLGTLFTLIGSVVGITVNHSQVHAKAKLPRENFGTNVTVKVLDVTNAVNIFHMLFHTGFIHKLSAANLTHVPGACWSGTLYSKMDDIHMFLKVSVLLEVL